MSSVPDNVKNSVTFAEAFKDTIRIVSHTSGRWRTTLQRLCMEAMFTPFTSRDAAGICYDRLAKRPKKRGSTVTHETNQTDLSFFSALIADERPYITLIAELGVQLPISPPAIMKTKAKGTYTASTSKLPKETARKPTAGEIPTSPATPSKVIIPVQLGIIHHPRDVHPRYSIYAYGCSNTVYNVISDF
ncbi:hypothetical protein PILCRDRAFT_11631 [Piloderma croceum F 1598]|uniref:Uncharacterized protein n=1 Tax=Piloderma croceum (strain F 1598) TaxID=765440 RepID=A0A0C3FDT0_PILCF|nr:hypothetical protein PILCRDRAFT_11631 [Piloderma croceum F 1598]